MSVNQSTAAPVPRPAPGGADEVEQPAAERRVAYLVSQYPTLSHAFIEREVAALRAAGAHVETWSVRATAASDARSAFARAEAARTRTLLGRSARDYLAAHLRCAAASPAGWAAGLRAAATSGPRRWKARVWQFFYLTEAVVLVEEMRRAGLHHVHVHFANNGADVARLAVAVGRAARWGGERWCWSFSMHGPTEFTDVVGHDLAAKVRSAASIACISEFCREELLATLPPGEVPAHRGKAAVVRMGVDAERYVGRGRERAERAVPGSLRVLFVGRLVPEKDPTAVVRAVAELRRRGLDVEARVVGEGPLRPELEAAVAETGAPVALPGGVGQDDLPEEYAWADVFCLPSHAEGVPAVLMEAMATELPVVTTRIAGIPELVVDGESGTLVDPGDATALADALDRVARDVDLRTAQGRAGRARVVAEFEPVLNGDRLLELWSSTTPPARQVPGRSADGVAG